MPVIVVKFFGPARDVAGVADISLDIRDGETVGGVAGILAKRYPKLGAALGLRLAVNRSYVVLDRVLSEGDEVAVIPPVSGGAPLQRVRLTREVIDVASLVEEMRTERAGAVATFVGKVRQEERDGKRLEALEYHAYDDMAIERMEMIRNRALTRFEIEDAAIIHRLGLLKLGEASVAVVVVAAHRAAAFEACRWIIDAVKADVPIWKKDVWADGSASWVDPT